MGWAEDRGHEALTVKLVRGAVKDSGPKAIKRAEKLRRKYPDATTEVLVDRLSTEYRSLTVVEGALAGAAAVMPGIGTAAAIILAVGEAALFMFASSRYILTRAVLEGMDPEDFDARLTLVMGAMLGPAGVAKAASSDLDTDRAWARTLATQRASTKSLTQQGLGRTFVSRYLIRKGAGVLGRALPFGVGALIGGLANFAGAQTVIDGADAAFGYDPANR